MEKEKLEKKKKAKKVAKVLIGIVNNKENYLFF